MLKYRYDIYSIPTKNVLWQIIKFHSSVILQILLVTLFYIKWGPISYLQLTVSLKTHENKYFRYLQASNTQNKLVRIAFILLLIN